MHRSQESPYLVYRPSFCIALNLFSIRRLPSINRSTQFFVQLSSFLSRFPPDIRPVMHFFQQTSVIECTAGHRYQPLSCGSIRSKGRSWLTLLKSRLLHLVVHELLELQLVLLSERGEIHPRGHRGLHCRKCVWSLLP